MAAAVDVATAATARDRGMEATGLGAAMTAVSTTDFVP
jgi:hypothetical protein